MSTVKKDPMLNIDFLKKLFEQKKINKYARVTSLSIEEYPIETIEGRVTQGSVNLDGSSSARRSCSLSMVSDPTLRLEDELNWALNTKIRIEIGLENFVDADYDPVIWFNMGLYCITSFSFSKSTSGCTISLQAKDKMCLINGDIGGEIYAAVDFGTEYIVDKPTGKTTIRHIPIEDIIRESVNEQAGEPYSNIVINDIPQFGAFMLEWRGEEPLYILVNDEDPDQGKECLFDQEVYDVGGNRVWLHDFKIGPPVEGTHYHYYCPLSSFVNTQTWDDYAESKVKLSSSDTSYYYVCKIESGQVAGYEMTDLTQPQEKEGDNALSVSVGGTLTQILDKIVEFLGDYEYFYNENGQFVFQKKSKSIDKAWSPEYKTDTTGLGVSYELDDLTKPVWNFSENEIVTQYNVSPKLNNIKNDYSIWGARKYNDVEVPIHLRYAIDAKPLYYKTIGMSGTEIAEQVEMYPEYADAFEKTDINGNTYKDRTQYIYYTEDCPTSWFEGDTTEAFKVDWREVIYQMAKDYLKFKHFDQFHSYLAIANTTQNNLILYPKGITGYEQYYVDLEANWRTLQAPRGLYQDNDRQHLEPVEDISSDDPEVGFNDNEIQVDERWLMLKSNEGVAPDIQNEYIGYEKFHKVYNPCYNGEYYEVQEHKSYPCFLTDPDNLSLDLYLNYDNSVMPDDPSETIPLKNSLSCWSSEAVGSTNRLRDPIYYLMGGEMAHAYNTLILANDSSGTSLPQFNGKGMGIYCDNRTTQSDDAIELMTLQASSMGAEARTEYLSFSSIPFGVNVKDAVGLEALGVFNVFRTNRYNLILPVISVPSKAYLEAQEVDSLVISSSNISDDFGFYNIYSLTEDATPTYDSTKTYMAGDHCKYNSHYQICIATTSGDFDSNAWVVDDPSGDYKGAKIEQVQQFIYGSADGHDRVLFRVNTPTIDGLTYYRDEKNSQQGKTGYVQKLGVGYQNNDSKENNLYFISRVTALSVFEKSGASKTFRFSVINSSTSKMVNLISYNNLDYTENDLQIYKYNGGVNSCCRRWRLYNTEPNYYLRPIYKDGNYYPFSTTFDGYSWKNKGIYFKQGDDRVRENLLPNFSFLKVNSYTGKPILIGSNLTDSFKYQVSEEKINYLQERIIYFFEDSSADETQKYWNVDLLRNPEKLTFWFDFLESSEKSEIANYGVDKIMDRSKATQEDKASSIDFRDSLNIMYRFVGVDKITEEIYDRLEPKVKEAQYPVFRVPYEMKDCFVVSSKYKSCKDVLDEWLYRYTQANETIAISAIPIYFLQPNDRILTADGEYIINSVSFPLAYNDTMNINATRAIDKLY